MTSTIHPPDRIAVGIDGSIESHAALRWAIRHARSGDTVVLLHAWHPSPATVEAGLVNPDDDSAARAFLHRERARVEALPRDPDVILESEVLHGDARELLCAADVDLLVIGAGRHGTLVGALLGSVSSHLVHHARVPLVIVPHGCTPSGPAVSS